MLLKKFYYLVELFFDFSSPTLCVNSQSSSIRNNIKEFI